MLSNNEMKRAALENIFVLCTNLENKVNVLNALDRDVDEKGAHDLHDQMVTFYKTVETLRGVMTRSLAIVPMK